MDEAKILSKLSQTHRDKVAHAPSGQKYNLLRRLDEGYEIQREDGGGDILIKKGFSYRWITYGGSDVAA